MSYIIYHNPRCSKSRESLQQLSAKQDNVQIIEYLKTPPDAKKIRQLLEMLGLPAEKLIRKKEAVWLENFAGKKLSEKQLIDAMIKFPALIERPIVVKGNKAWIARDEETISKMLR